MNSGSPNHAPKDEYEPEYMSRRTATHAPGVARSSVTLDALTVVCRGSLVSLDADVLNRTARPRPSAPLSGDRARERFYVTPS